MAEGAGVLQNDGGVKGEGKGGSVAESLFEVMKQINEPRTSFDGERDQLTARRSLVSMMKHKTLRTTDDAFTFTCFALKIKCLHLQLSREA